MIIRSQAYELLISKLHNQNLVRHCLSVEAVMKSLARHFQADEAKWGIVGLLHDGDYEISKDHPAEHTLLMAQWLRDLGETDPEIHSAILSHNYAHLPADRQAQAHSPTNKLEWSLYCCDELTGLIVACALVQPTKKLADVSVESVLKKWDSKSFAAGVHRDQIIICEEKLGLKLSDFINIALTSMQGIASEIGL